MRAVTVSVAPLGLFFLAEAEPTGSIAGIVYDAATCSPLAGDADGRSIVTDTSRSGPIRSRPR